MNDRTIATYDYRR